MRPRRFLATALLVAVALTCGACLHTSMLPARHLNAGDLVYGGGLHMPSVLYTPEAFGQVTYGLGGADLSANGTIGPGAVTAGAAGRVYLPDPWHLEMEIRGGELSGERFLLLALGGLQRVPTEDRGLYYGIQGGILRGDEPFGPTYRPKTTPIIGATAGLGDLRLSGNWQLQIELDATVAPMAGDPGPTPPARVSVGVFHDGNDSE